MNLRLTPKPMTIKNSTEWSDTFLRRMTSWCCKELDMPVRLIKRVMFRNSRSAWGGCARTWRGQITVCVGRAELFPAGCGTHRVGEKFADRIECLVAVTAHEAYHVAAYADGNHRQHTRGYGTEHQRRGSSERVTCEMEMRALDAFRLKRDELLTDWSREPETKPVIPASARKLVKAMADLTRWERKLKLAQTKVRKYRRTVTRLEKASESLPLAA